MTFAVASICVLVGGSIGPYRARFSTNRGAQITLAGLAASLSAASLVIAAVLPGDELLAGCLAVLSMLLTLSLSAVPLFLGDGHEDRREGDADDLSRREGTR